MAAEKGGKDGWKIERCYMKEQEMIEIMAGDFFICHAPISSEKFLSLPPDLEKKYSEKFRYPEKFVRMDDGIKRWHKFQADVEREFLRPEKSGLKWQ